MPLGIFHWRLAFVNVVIFILFSTSVSFAEISVIDISDPFSSAHILETQVVAQDEDTKKWHQYEFKVLKAGQATLKLSNGARIDSSYLDRTLGITVILCPALCAPEKEQHIVSLSQWSFFFHDLLEIPLDLQPGSYIVKVQLNSRPGKKVAVRIDAPADQIVLKPLTNPGVEGDPLRAVATVTGLGVPVSDAQVRFTVAGTDVEKTVSTSTSGTAAAFLEDVPTEATTLQATVVETSPTLLAETSLTVLGSRGLLLTQRPGTLRLESGESELLEYRLDIQAVEGVRDQITLKPVVTPADGGVLVVPDFPTEGMEVTAVGQIPVTTKIVAKTAGSYTVMTTATNTDTGETYQVTLPVEVIPPGTPDPLILGIPLAQPSGIEEDMLNTVIFRAQVDGTSTPPNVLFLDELDLMGQPRELRIAELRDDGKGVDAEAGDQIYSGIHEINGPASELRFRVRTVYFGEMVVSGATTFLITPVPQNARPSDPDLLVPVSDTLSQIFANEVEIQVLPGTSPEDVEEIAASIDGTVVGVIPPLRLYLIEFPNTGNANGVVEAIVTLSTFSQVERATPNYEVLDAAVPVPCGASCPNDGASQWYLDTIEARQAWDIAGGGNANHRVAVIDELINCDHPDLASRCTGAGTNAHSTQVAGLIAANAHNSQGIAGLAWNTMLESEQVVLNSSWTLKAAIMDMSGPVKVVHIPQKVNISVETNANTLKEAICNVTAAEKLVVVAGGDIVTESDEADLYPARFNLNSTCTITGGATGPMNGHLLAVGALGAINDVNPVDGTTPQNRSAQRAIWGSKKSSDAAYLDLYAPGTNIQTLSTGVSDVTSVNGTSFASALVAGAAAVLSAHDDFTTPSGQTRAQAVHDRLKTTAIITASGLARLNLQAAVTIPNVPPVLAALEGAAFDYVENDGAVSITSAITISDVDDIEIESATVQITDSYQSAEDVLAFPSTPNITGTWDGSVGKLSLVGADTLVNYQMALRAVTYQNISEDPNTLARTVSFTVNDGDDPSNTVTRNVTVAALIDPPPLDLVLVLDRSGSMSLSTHIDPALADNRWEALISAVDVFTDILPDHVPPDSQLGLTLFANQAFDDRTPGFQYNNHSFYTEMFPIDEALHALVGTELEAQNPFGLTALGDGLRDGIDKDRDPTRERVVVVFTDGAQNVLPLVNNDGGTFSDGSQINPSPSARIIPVGLGVPIDSHLTMLQGLATQNDGTLVLVDNVRTGGCTDLINEIFDCVLAPALAGSSPQMVSSYKGILSQLVETEFFLNKYATKLLIKLSFSGVLKDSELLSIMKEVRIIKDGKDITKKFQATSLGRKTNTILFKTKFERPRNHKGDVFPADGHYKVVVKPSVTRRNLGYKIVTYVDDHSLDLDWKVNPVTPQVNKSFYPTVSLRWRGKSISSASVEAWIYKPGDDLGHLLAMHPLKVEASSSLDSGSLGYQKYHYLLQNDPKFLAQLRPTTERLVLSHKGSGRYSAPYRFTDVSGVYQIVYEIRAEDPAFGKIQRKAVQSLYLQSGKIDFDQSIVNLTTIGNTTTIKIQPVTRYGRYLGPGQSSGLSVDGVGTTLSSITDHQDGSYSLVITGNPEREINLKLSGKEIYQGTISKIKEKIYGLGRVLNIGD